MSRDPSRRLALLAAGAGAMADVWLARRLNRPPRSLPILLAFLTHRCNLSCAMCGVGHLPAGDGSGELETAEWRAVFDAAGRLRTRIVSISGGEVLLRPDLFELIAHARDRGMAVHVCTNATRIDAGVAGELRDAGTHTVSLSLEGPDAASHDALRGEGSFDATVRGVQALREHAPGIRLGVNVLLSRRNHRDAPAVVALAGSLGAHQVRFMPIHRNLLHRHRSDAELDGLGFRASDLGELERTVAELRRVAARTSLQLNSRRHLDGIVDFYCRPRRFRCVAGFAVCAVGPRGEVSPCCDLDARETVRDRPLDDIWFGREFHTLRRRVVDCPGGCWDTTNTELSLRLSARGLLADVRTQWQDLGFYFHGEDA